MCAFYCSAGAWLLKKWICLKEEMKNKNGNCVFEIDFLNIKR